jgi:hypothetical protein
MRGFSSVPLEGKRRKHMTIEEALKKATAGGYHIYGSDGMDTYYEGASNAYSAWTRKDNASTFVIAVEETFLDPAFWQALGKAVGWSEETEAVVRYRVTEPAWQSYWHRFIDYLAEGNTAESFFEQLPEPEEQAHARHSGRPPCGKPERRQPHRGDDYWYLSNSVFAISSAQWDDDGTDEARWSVGNVFVSHAHAEQAQDQIQELLIRFHEDNR